MKETEKCFLFGTSLLTFTFRPDWVERLPGAYPTDNVTFLPKVVGKKREKVANEVLPPAVTKISKE